MNDAEFRALLDMFMCSDPYPCEGHDEIESLLIEESEKRGFGDWITAYHVFKAV
ncbi:MAG: hypothetical protein ACYDG4_13365 [Desulfuromonadaceae bacterium]